MRGDYPRLLRQGCTRGAAGPDLELGRGPGCNTQAVCVSGELGERSAQGFARIEGQARERRLHEAVRESMGGCSEPWLGEGGSVHWGLGKGRWLTWRALIQVMRIRTRPVRGVHPVVLSHTLLEYHVFPLVRPA